MQSTRPYGIKGVTDNVRPPVIQKAKIGRKNEKGYPEKLDYISFVEPGEEGIPCPAFDVLGTRPQSFLGAFPSDDTETFVDAPGKGTASPALSVAATARWVLTARPARNCSAPVNTQRTILRPTSARTPAPPRRW